MRRPRRPSRPARSERRRPRSDPSWRSEPFNGTWTCRPSRVTTTATRRRSWRSNRPNVVSRQTWPSRPGRFAQSTRHLVIVQPPGPHVIARACTKERGPGGRPAGSANDSSRGPAPDPRPGQATRPPVSRRPRRDWGRSVKADRSHTPALPRLENECRAGERGEGQQHSEGVSLQHSSHGLNTNEGPRRSSGRVTPRAPRPT
jgi:hypothetical protein